MKYKLEIKETLGIPVEPETFAEWLSGHPSKPVLTVIKYTDGYVARLDAPAERTRLGRPWGYNSGRAPFATIEGAIRALRDVIASKLPRRVPLELGSFEPE